MTNILSLTNLIHQQLVEIIRQIDCIKNNSYNNLKIEFNKHQQEIIYQTPYCLQVAKYINQNPFLLANKIVNKFNERNNNQDLIGKVSGKGWLEFIVSDRLIENYLNSLNKYPITFTNKINNFSQKKEVPFLKYYLHSRCYSLLRSAHYQEIIQLNNLDFILNQWQIIQPENQCYRIFYSSNDLEQKIIKEILLVIEKITTNKIAINKALKILEKLFFLVESNSRIWGMILQKNKKLSQARLGLIGLILYCYQNIFYLEYQQELNVEEYSERSEVV